MEKNTYTCEVCKETYTKITTDEEARKEMQEIMPEAMDDPIAILCHECWLQFMKWFEKLTPEQKKKMREENLQ